MPELPESFPHEGRVLQWNVQSQSDVRIVGPNNHDTVSVLVAGPGAHQISVHFRCYRERPGGWLPELTAATTAWGAFSTYFEKAFRVEPYARLQNVTAFEVAPQARTSYVTVIPDWGENPDPPKPRIVNPDGFVVNMTHHAFDQYGFEPDLPGPWELAWDSGALVERDDANVTLRLNYCDGTNC